MGIPWARCIRNFNEDTPLKLRDAIQPGDWLLICPKKDQLLGKIIRKFTFGEVTHAAIVVDKDTLFETDGDMFQAGFTDPSKKYEGRKIYIVSPKSLRGKDEEIMELGMKYSGVPYSYWDIGTNILFFWLAGPLRRKLIGLFGTKAFMLCSELVARVSYEVGHREELRTFEGVSPEDLRELALLFPEEYGIKVFNPNNL